MHINMALKITLVFLYTNTGYDSVCNNHPNMIAAILSSPDKGEYMPPHLASRRDSSSRPSGESESVVTRASTAAHPTRHTNSE